MKREDETEQDKADRVEREKAAHEADPEGFQLQLREANLRAVYAHVSTLLEKSRDKKNPMIGLAYVAFTERSVPFWSFSGSLESTRTIGALQCLQATLLNVFAARDPKQFMVQTDMGLGDTVEVDGKGRMEIKCQGDDAVEAEREKAENANRLVRELSIVAARFYGKKLPADIRDALVTIGEHSQSELVRLKAENYYAETGDD